MFKIVKKSTSKYIFVNFLLERIFQISFKNSNIFHHLDVFLHYLGFFFVSNDFSSITYIFEGLWINISSNAINCFLASS